MLTRLKRNLTYDATPLYFTVKYKGRPVKHYENHFPNDADRVFQGEKMIELAHNYLQSIVCGTADIEVMEKIRQIDEEICRVAHRSRVAFYVEFYMDAYQCGIFSLAHVKLKLKELEEVRSQWEEHINYVSYLASVEGLREVIAKIEEELK